MPVTDTPTPERRNYERRAGWHTPDTCEKVNGVQAQVKSLKAQVEATHEKVTCIEGKLDTNNAATAELLEIIQMGKGFFRVVGWIGKWLRRIVMWVVPPVAAIVGLWQSIRPPK